MSRTGPSGGANPTDAWDPIARPIFIVSPPRAGSRLLARALGLQPGTWTAGHAAGALLAAVPAPEPALAGESGGRLTASDCEPELRRTLRAGLCRTFLTASGHPTQHAEVRPRLFDASPRNALMVPFLNAAFPDAVFVYVHREPRDALAESLAMWRSGGAVTYPRLAGWTGPAWSFLLVPQWRELDGRPLAEVVTEQWTRTMRTLISDLEALPPSRWCVTDHDALTADPATELARLFGFLGLGSGATADTPPASARGARPLADTDAAATELLPYLPRTRALRERAAGWIAEGTGHAQ